MRWLFCRSVHRVKVVLRCCSIPLRVAVVLVLVAAGVVVPAAEVRVITNLPYKTGALSDYERSRCKLDLYLPSAGTNRPVLVWFHGGALKEGSKDEDGTRKIARSLAESGLATAVVNYRLSPQAIYPAYVDDAAASVAFVHRHAREHGLDPSRVFAGGHSAGGYLTAMVGMDPRHLAKHGMQASNIAGLAPVSGQMMTHYTIREERGITNRTTIVADEAAPIHHARRDTPPWLIFFADNDMASRAEENLYFAAVLRASGNRQVKYQQVENRDHGSIASRMTEPNDVVTEAILQFTGVKPGN